MTDPTARERYLAAFRADQRYTREHIHYLRTYIERNADFGDRMRLQPNIDKIIEGSERIDALISVIAELTPDDGPDEEQIAHVVALAEMSRRAAQAARETCKE